MKPKHEDLVQAEFARRAQAPALTETDEVALRRLIQAVAPVAGERILDVACGAGVVSCALGRSGAQVVGLDITRPLLHEARRHRHEQGLTNVRFERGEAQALPFPDATFDAVVCRLSIHHFSEPERVVAEMARVVSPGGRVVVADLITADDPDQARLHNALERLRDPSHWRMWTEAELVGLLREQGLEVVHSERWRQRRHFSEWISKVNAPEREEPLKVVLGALARAGLTAGIDLRLEPSGEPVFEQRWLLLVARSCPAVSGGGRG